MSQSSCHDQFIDLGLPFSEKPVIRIGVPTSASIDGTHDTVALFGFSGLRGHTTMSPTLNFATGLGGLMTFEV